jgi:O-antigen/teichoic acid export membrane protein
MSLAYQKYKMQTKKNLEQSLIGTIGIYTISNFAVAGVPFLLLPFLTRLIEPAEYGKISIFMLLIAFLQVFIGLNTHGAISVRYFDRSTFNIKRYVTTIIIMSMIMTVSIALIFFILSDYVQSITNIPTIWIFVAVGAALCQYITLLTLVIWQVSNEPLKYGALRISHALSESLLALLLVFILYYSWQGRLAGISLSLLIISTYCLYYLYRHGWLYNRIDKTALKDALQFGIPLVPHAIGGLVLSLSDRLLVTTLIDISTTGVYVVAAQIGLTLGMLADSFNKAFAPWLMSKLSNPTYKLKSQIVKKTYCIFIFFLTAAAVMSYFSNSIISTISGDKYLEAAGPLKYILFGNAFTAMYYLVTNYVFYERKTPQLSIATTIIAFVTVAITWKLILVYGSTGAAAGYMLGQLALFLTTFGLANKYYPMPWLKGIFT